MTDTVLINNLWIVVAALLVFLMTIAIGFLEYGELGRGFSNSIMKTILITGAALFLMAFIGFDIAFAPTFHGVIGNPVYNGLFFSSFFYNASSAINGTWWSMTSQYFGTGLTTGTYFLYETAFASVTLAIVGVVALRKMKMSAFLAYSAVYYILIWTLPAAWIWNPTGWLYKLGVRDFGGGLVVHAAAGIAGLAIVLKIWQEEKKKGLSDSPQTPTSISPAWLTLSILLLWVGWFGFNAGSVLAFSGETVIVGLNTFLGAASAFISTMLFRYLITRKDPGYVYAVNGLLVGLILMSPLSGYISPIVAVIIGFIGGPLFLVGERLMTRKWFSDPIGLFPTHLLMGLFGFLMIAFVAQTGFSAASGAANLPNGLIFGGGMAALKQLGVQALAAVVVAAFVFSLSYVSLWLIGKFTNGITTEYEKIPSNSGSVSSIGSTLGAMPTSKDGKK
ncbi:MAG: ammonium transporter [Candidatus Thermoplasmatota archaeon]|nr:ammonium transporter [Candidatus Thermoplasmatota archaeon]MCL5789585.1 ammonium transporter [Candidatus Thermoplasmatota archaeon]